MAIALKNISICPFRAGDESAIASLVAHTLKISNGNDYSPEYIDAIIKEHSPEYYSERRNDSHFYVACDGDKIIGCGGITGYWGSTSESFLLSIFVLPEYQGGGTGRRIINTLEKDAFFTRAWRTEVASSVTAVEFYKKLGYTYKNGITTPDEHGVIRLEKLNRSIVLETERLILRPWYESDAEECYKYAQDERVGHPAGWQAHTSVENSREIIRDVLSDPETYAIVLKQTNLPIGSIGLHHNDLAKDPDEREFGYWIGVPYWGQGLVPEAAREMLRHAFEDLKLNRVWCAYYDGNEKSKRVQEKLGFRYQWTNDAVPVPLLGEVRKGQVNLMTKEQWLEG